MTARRNQLKFILISACLTGMVQLILILIFWGLPQLGIYLPMPPRLAQHHLWQWGLPTLFGLLVASVTCIQWLRMHRFNATFERDAVTYLIYPRADRDSGGCSAGTQFWNQVVDLLPKREHLILSISRVADQRIQFQITALPESCRTVLHQLLADWPGTQVRQIDKDDRSFSAENRRPTTHLRLAPTRTTEPLQTRVEDPMLAPLVELSQLPDGVEAGLKVYVRRDWLTQRQQLRKAQRQAAARKRVAKLQTNPQPPTLTEQRADRAEDERADRAFLEVQIVIWAAADTIKQARAVARSLARDVSAQFGIANPIVQFGEKRTEPPDSFPLYAGRPLTDIELGSLMHLLGKDGVQLAPQLATATARNLEPAQSCRVPIEAQRLLSVRQIRPKMAN